MSRPARSARPSRPGSTTATVTFRIDDLAPGGDGVGHLELDRASRAVFVPRTAVGDVVTVTIDPSSRPARPARGARMTLVSPGPDRVAAPCEYVEACGACDWMHLSRDAQRAARLDHLRRALPAPFKEIAVHVHDALPSVGYRTRARLHVRASGGRAIVGPHSAGSKDVVDVATCLVLDPALDAAIGVLSRALEGAHGLGEASLALGEGRRPVVELRWDGRVPGVVFGRMEDAVQRGLLGGMSLYVGAVSRPAIIGDPTPMMTAGTDAPLAIAPGGFAQASEAGNALLGARVVALAELALGPPRAQATPRVVELYAGAGNFTLLLARAWPQLTAVEASAPACDAARKNLAARGLTARVVTADADTFAVPPRTDLVVLDPPRRGAREACAALASSSVRAIVYVSCDAATLGRDLALLAERYDAVALESFSMFPGTSHSETVVALTARPPRPPRPEGAPT